MQQILLYNLNNDKGRRIGNLCRKLSIPVRTVDTHDYLQPLGSLVGLPGFSADRPAYQGAAFSDEMMLFNDFADKPLYDFLAQYREAGIDPVPLKAGITPTNAYWDSIQLFRAISEEHQMMSGKR